MGRLAPEKLHVQFAAGVTPEGPVTPRRYTLTHSDSTEAVHERQTILQRLLGQVGQNSVIEPPFCCVYGQNIHPGAVVSRSVPANTVVAGNPARVTREIEQQ